MPGWELQDRMRYFHEAAILNVAFAPQKKKKKKKTVKPLASFPGSPLRLYFSSGREESLGRRLVMHNFEFQVYTSTAPAGAYALMH